MAEPQDESVVKVMMQTLEESKEKLLNQSRNLPQETVASIERSQARLNLLKADIDTEMMNILEKIDGIKSKISDNILNDANPYGLLKQKKEDYFKCLELGHCQLENLFRQDAALWTKDL